MKKGLTEIVFILDRSGSMSGLETDTIGGYNSMLEKQKAEEGEALLSTVLFDDRVEILHDRKSLSQVKPITEKEYFVRGSTALLDAVGGAIRHIGKLQKSLSEEERPEKTIFIITTDGMENSSREYSYDKVKKMVEKKKTKKQWEFIFLGANIDAVKEAGRLGIAANRSARYNNDKKSVRRNYGVVSGMLKAARCAPSADAMEACISDGGYLDEIRDNYKEED